VLRISTPLVTEAPPPHDADSAAAATDRWTDDASQAIAEERYRDAVQAASRAIAIDPTRADALLLRAAAYHRLRLAARALDDLTAAANAGFPVPPPLRAEVTAQARLGL
jgi:Flp pilus assembly protein TadD